MTNRSLPEVYLGQRVLQDLEQCVRASSSGMTSSEKEEEELGETIESCN